MILNREKTFRYTQNQVFEIYHVLLTIWRECLRVCSLIVPLGET